VPDEWFVGRSYVLRLDMYRAMLLKATLSFCGVVASHYAESSIHNLSSVIRNKMFCYE